MNGPIVVEKGSWSLRGKGWVWRCKEHTRCRGYHAYFTRTQEYYRRMGKVHLLVHPWVRAINGAVEHWHKFHAPTHTCCLPKSARTTPLND